MPLGTETRALPDADDIYAAPRQVLSVDDCYFYHTMEIPGHGLFQGEWDVRGRAGDFVAHLPLAEKRVLEIGPASGYVTFEMEARGASVVSVELPQEQAWNFVPYPPDILAPAVAERRAHMRRLQNAYWLAHVAHKSSARVCYADAHQLPEALGRFDVALMANVLLHCHGPLQVIEQCASRADTLIIVEMTRPELEGQPVCRLAATAENREWDTWWHFSTDVLVRYLQVLGFGDIKRVDFTLTHSSKLTFPFFTLVASRG